MRNYYRFEEPPLLGPGAGFPTYGPPDFHQTTEAWKGAPIHPTGLMKEPPIAAGRNAPVNFATTGQQQVRLIHIYKSRFFRSFTEVESLEHLVILKIVHGKLGYLQQCNSFMRSGFR